MRLTQIRELVLIAAMLALIGALGSMIWERRGYVAFLRCQGFRKSVLWRWLLWESALLLSVGCLTGAVFGICGQLLLSHALASVTGFPISFGVEAVRSAHHIRALERRRRAGHRHPGISPGACSATSGPYGQLTRAPGDQPRYRRCSRHANYACSAKRPAESWDGLLPAVAREVRAWRSLAAAIPDRPIRQDALSSLANKRGHTDGAALFCIFTRSREPALLRLLVAYEIMWDFLDSVNERGAARGQPNGKQLHLALVDGLDPDRPVSDYYRHHPWHDDGGYLNTLVQTCRETCVLLRPTRSLAHY